MNTKTKKIIGIALVIVLAVAMIFAYVNFREQTAEGNKTVTIEVTAQNKAVTTYTVNTDALYLKEVMEEADGLTFSGTEGPYGVMITEVNGEVADYNTNGAYWAFYVNGEYCNYGIDEQSVEDGDVFGIVYTAA